MKTKPGRTAFISNVQLYDLLSEEEKEMAENSWVEYAPFPYMWIENCKGNANGLGLVTQVFISLGSLGIVLTISKGQRTHHGRDA